MLYRVTYGDYACGHTLGIFSTKEKAEKFLEYFDEIDEESWMGSLPTVSSFYVDDFDRPYLIRDIDLNEEGKIERSIGQFVEITTPRDYQRLLHEPEGEMYPRDFNYRTTTLNKEQAELEALAAWMVMMIEKGWQPYIVSDKDFDEDEFPGDSWMAQYYDL